MHSPVVGPAPDCTAGGPEDPQRHTDDGEDDAERGEDRDAGEGADEDEDDAKGDHAESSCQRMMATGPDVGRSSARPYP